MLTPVKMHKAEKYGIRRGDCSASVITRFLRTFGCRRKVYNLFTDRYCSGLEEAGYTGGDDIPDVELPEVSVFKKEYPYLKEVDSLALANARIDFLSAVRRYKEEYDHVSYTKRALRRDASGTEKLSFRGLKGMPRFKSKARGDFSFKTNCQYPKEGNKLTRPTIRLERDMLYIPKFHEGIPLVIHRPLPDDAVIGNVTVSMDTDGSLYASVEYTYTLLMDISIRDAAVRGDDAYLRSLNILGLDYSQKDFYVDSEGRKANYPHYYRKSEGRLAHLQRQLSRMEKGSKNYERKLRQVQALHTKIKHQRLDFVCKEAAYLASAYDAVAVEDINLRAIGSSLSLGKNLHDNGFGMFRRRLAEKLEAKGSVLIKVSKSFPSTKKCHVCGCVNPDVTLDVREWVCPECGTFHLRDDNAAINIREEGRRIFGEYFRNWLASDEAARRLAEARSEGRHRKRTKKSA